MTDPLGILGGVLVWAADSGNFIEGLLSPLVNLLVAILNFFEGFLHNYGWAIVFLTVLVRIVLIPLTWRQAKSMRALQRLQPQMKELQEKHKDDRQVLNQKMMEFYQENKVNPFGSCLPLVLQMPVFFALYYAIREIVPVPTSPGYELQILNPEYHWLWIRVWSESQPWWIAKTIGEFDLILLFFYVGSQFLSSRLMATSTDPTQRMIMYIMPLAIGVFMFVGKWPAGLFIYWVTSNLWTIGQQYVINRTMPPPAAVAAPSGGTGGASKERKKPQAKSRKR